MTREETKAAIEVMQAWLDGAEIEGRDDFESDTWGPMPEPLWNWISWDYRVAKQAPKKITLQAWLDEFGELRWVTPTNTVSFIDSWTRVPSEDKTVEIEE